MFLGFNLPLKCMKSLLEWSRYRASLAVFWVVTRVGIPRTERATGKFPECWKSYRAIFDIKWSRIITI